MPAQCRLTRSLAHLAFFSSIGLGTPAAADEPPPDESPPKVAITTPSDGASFPAGSAALTVEVDAKDAQTGVSTVWLFIDDKEVAKLDKAPYEFESVPISAGAHTLVAKAANWDGAKAESAAVKITWADSNPEPKSAAESKSKADANADTKDGCFASARPRSLAGSGVALLFAVFAGLMLRRRA